jgi:predicted nucleotide-binding protein (sugar kinase/HSP70/actin superfamily)
MTQPHIETRKSLPLVDQNAAPAGSTDDVDIERELAAFEAAERKRLGMRNARKHWVDEMIDPQFTKEERAHVTLLVSGLTKAQDFLVEGALRGVGYNVQDIGCPDQEGLQAGKEYGNRGQCNPTYFTVGNLVKHLIYLRDEKGMTAQEVIDNYIFLTAGACGPCRFGMYVTEYRKALRDAGFDGFRVMLFQQQGGLDQATGEEAGLNLNPEFFIAIVKAIVCGDVLNALGYRIRPYEVEAGATDRAIEEAKRLCYRALLHKENILMAMMRSRRLFAGIEVDKLRARPKVSIIGEFWAMTTEGDGNYHLQQFLESEGAECDIQLTTAWLLYNIWEIDRDTRERASLREADGGQYGLEDYQGEFAVAKRLATLNLAEKALRLGFEIFALPPGLHDYPLPDMDKVAEVADAYYSNDLRGGEGHMEVGKLILNVVKSKANMTLSVKPFGCMPSSGVSDGVQSLITAKYPGTIFCAVETSGDGATNFYSRVQMYLYKARISAEEELATALRDTGVTREQVEQFLRDNSEYASPLHHAPHGKAACEAANLVYQVAPLIKHSRLKRGVMALEQGGRRAAQAAAAAPGRVRSAWRKVKDPEFQAAVKIDAELVTDLARGKVAELYAPVVQKLMGKAYYENNSDIPGMDEALAAE